MTILKENDKMFATDGFQMNTNTTQQLTITCILCSPLFEWDLEQLIPIQIDDIK